MKKSSKKYFLVSVLALTTSLFSVYGADEPVQKSIYEEERGIGFYTALQTGQLYFTGADRSLFKDGWVVGFKGGYSFMKFLASEMILKISGHHTTTASALTGLPKSFFMYQLLGQMKGAYPIFNRFQLGGGLGGGLFYSSPNQKPTIGTSSRFGVYGELTAEYFFRTRGLSVILDPSFAAVADHKSLIVQLTGSLRYTF